MHCSVCKKENDLDAQFCERCGSALAQPRKQTRSWMYVLILLPVLVFAGGIGYYKFILPSGIAAEVNGEKISLAELDARLRSNGALGGVPAEMQGRVRYAALSELITERIALQEARSAGITVSSGEVQTAVDGMRDASGLDEKVFAERVAERYGSMRAFRTGIEQRLVVRKYIDEKIMAGALNASDANERMNRWLQGATAKAAVRVALDEQFPSAGCGCCSGKSGAAAGARKGCDPKGGCGPAKGTSAGAAQASAAQEAALAYWQQRNDSGPVETKVTDFGCHVQVDIIANNRIAQSLRYQNGTITEM